MKEIHQLYKDEEKTVPIDPIVSAASIRWGNQSLEGAMSQLVSDANVVMENLQDESERALSALEQIRYEIRNLRESGDVDAAVVAKIAMLIESMQSVEDDLRKAVLIDGNIEPDLEIGDDLHRVLVRLALGHIMTKYFDSSKTPYLVDTSADFELGDEVGRVLFQLTQGHIKTKNFDSRNIYTKAEVDALIRQAISNSGGNTQPDTPGAPDTPDTPDVPDTPEEPSEEEPINEIKMLFFGNSYTEDILSAIRIVMNEMMPSVNYIFGVYYHPGMVLRQLNDYMDWKVYAGEVGKEGNWKYWEITKSGLSEEVLGTTPTYALNAQTWDWISMQQGTTDQRDASTYPMAATVKSKILAKLSYVPKFAFTHVHNRPIDGNNGATTFVTQASSTDALLANHTVESIIPAGVALQSLRTVSRFVELGDNETYHNMTVDGLHLQNGIGRLVEALVIGKWLSTILHHSVNVEKSVLIGTTKTDYDYNDKRGEVIGIDLKNVTLARKAVTFAMQNPNQITNMNQYDI